MTVKTVIVLLKNTKIGLDEADHLIQYRFKERNNPEIL